MTWSTAVNDLRTFLSDGPSDKRRYRKRVFGDQDLSNTIFSTFEPRRLTDFTTAAVPEGVFINGSQQATATADDLVMGEFDLGYAPGPNDRVEATYYCQWFFDSELDVFLKHATQFLGLGPDWTVIQDGLQPAALHYAAQEAYSKLATRWAERASDQFLLEDSPQKEIKAIIDSYRAMSADFQKKSVQLRDDFYKRQGRANAPSFRTVSGRVRDLTPGR